MVLRRNSISTSQIMMKNSFHICQTSWREMWKKKKFHPLSVDRASIYFNTFGDVLGSLLLTLSELLQFPSPASIFHTILELITSQWPHTSLQDETFVDRNKVHKHFQPFFPTCHSLKLKFSVRQQEAGRQADNDAAFISSPQVLVELGH